MSPEKTIENTKDVNTQEAKSPEPKKEAFMFFTVSVASPKKIVHYLVKAESAMNALVKTQEKTKAPVIGIHITEYAGFLDVTEQESKICEIGDPNV